jgi:aminopeptidase N
MKLFILSTLVLFSNILFAQDATMHPCANAKIKALNKTQHNVRALNTNDNTLMNKYDVRYYHLDITSETGTLFINAASTIKATVQATSLDTFAYELSHFLTVDSVVYNGAPITMWRIADMGYALLPISAANNSNISVTIFYHGNCPSTGSGAIGYGYSNATSGTWSTAVTSTLSESYSAYHWFACKQSLQDFADSSSVYITTSNFNKAGSNGLLIGIDSLPGNKLKYKWHNNTPINYYLISLSVAKYVDYTIYAHPNNLTGDSIMIQNYVYSNPGCLPYWKNGIDTMALMVKYFSEQVSLFPFYKQKYGVCMAPIGGGMEHQTMSTQSFYEFNLNAHELFHQWFGDNVTCKTWSDIFINEGFASYGEYMALDYFKGYASAQSNMLDVHNNVMSQAGGSVYTSDTTSNRIFDSRLSYDKGAAVIHTLRFVLGDTLFFKTLKLFQTQYANSTASVEDFKNVAQTVSGMNLTDFFNQWIYGEGYMNINAEYASNGNVIKIKLMHTGSMAANNLYKTPLQIKCLSASGDTTVLVNLTTNTDNFIIPCTKTITGLTIDPNNWILNKVGTITKGTDLFLGTENIATSSIELFPNPAKDFVNIKSTQQLISYKILNILGQTIVSNSNFTNSKINISNLKTGVYWLQLYDAVGNESKLKLEKY